MKICMLSGPDKTKYFSKKIEYAILGLVTNPRLMVVIPANPYNKEKNERHFNGNNETIGVCKTFKKIFPNLGDIILLDSRVNKTQGIKYLKEADIIYLLGGNPFEQLDYLKNNNYDEEIIKSDAVVIGVSAGSMNLSMNSYCSRDDEFPKSIFYKGLGLVDITIDPHFDINDKVQVDEIRKHSKLHRIIGLPNNSAIVINNNNIKFIGKNYIFEEGKIIQREEN